MNDSKWTEPKLNENRVMFVTSKETGNQVMHNIWRKKWTQIKKAEVMTPPVEKKDE